MIKEFINYKKDKEKNTYCVLFGVIRLNVDYEYAIFYFWKEIYFGLIFGLVLCRPKTIFIKFTLANC